VLLGLHNRLKPRILLTCDLVGEQGAAPSMTPLVVMVVDEDHGMLGVCHAPTLVVHASQLTKLLPRNATSNLYSNKNKLLLYRHVVEALAWHVHCTSFSMR
jgi:hypothetical protein